MKWPYKLEWDKTETVEADVLVLGGGAAGCFAAVAAAEKGAKVALVEKGATVASGAAGSGCDHWESAATNPCYPDGPNGESHPGRIDSYDDSCFRRIQ